MKPMNQMSEQEKNRLLDRMSIRIEKLLPPDCVYAILICNHEGVAIISDGDRRIMIEALRMKADKLEKDLIESN